MCEEYTDKQIVEMLKPKLEKLGYGGIAECPEDYPTLCGLCATLYKSGYIRGQLGRSFIIGEKKGKDSNISFKVGDKVKLINREYIEKDNHYFPPIDTVGKVVELGSDYCFVQWPNGITSDNGIWACPNKYLEKISECWVPATFANIKKGDKVRMIDEAVHKSNPDCYPPVGTVGVVIDNSFCRVLPLVQWLKNSVGVDNVRHCFSHCIEVLVCE